MNQNKEILGYGLEAKFVSIQEKVCKVVQSQVEFQARKILQANTADNLLALIVLDVLLSDFHVIHSEKFNNAHIPVVSVTFLVTIGYCSRS